MRLCMQNHRILVMKSYAPFSKRPSFFLTFIRTIDIGLNQILMKNLKENAQYHKINILAEKAQMIVYAFLNHFSIVCVWRATQFLF